jgi:hypothetical protein
VAFTPKDGDTYTLYVMVGGTWQKQSSGTVTANESGSFSFTPSSGKPAFTASLEGSTLAVTSTITLDNGNELPGLSLDSEDPGATAEPVYTSFAEAKAAGASFGHNDALVAAYISNGEIISSELSSQASSLRNNMDYAKIKISGNTPVDSSRGFDIKGFLAEMGATGGDYFKWDIQYDDHRILVNRFVWRFISGGGYHISGTEQLVNEVLIYRPIDGTDYATGVAQVQHYAGFNYDTYQRNDSYASDVSSARNSLSATTWTVDDYEPVDNLNFLQYKRVLNAAKTNWQAGDYIHWLITYQNDPVDGGDDTTWRLKITVTQINSGLANGFSYNVDRVP